MGARPTTSLSEKWPHVRFPICSPHIDLAIIFLHIKLFFVWVFVLVCVCLCVHCMYLCACWYVCLCVHIGMCVFVCTNMCACVQMLKCVYCMCALNLFVCFDVCDCVCMLVGVYICVCMCVWRILIYGLQLKALIFYLNSRDFCTCFILWIPCLSTCLDFFHP